MLYEKIVKMKRTLICAGIAVLLMSLPMPVVMTMMSREYEVRRIELEKEETTTLFDAFVEEHELSDENVLELLHRDKPVPGFAPMLSGYYVSNVFTIGFFFLFLMLIQYASRKLLPEEPTVDADAG